jgi:hypothetical protein
MTKRPIAAAICGALVGAILLAFAPALSQQKDRPRQASSRRELHREEQQLRQARRVTRRILHDRRASEQMKQQATELDRVLTERERQITSLENLHRDFVARNRADIDALAELRRQAMEIDKRLRSARQDVLAAHEAEVRELVAGSERAKELVSALTDASAAEKRARRQ